VKQHQHPVDLPNYLSVKDVAVRLGLGLATVYKLIDSKHLPGVRLPGLDRVLVPREAFQNYLAAAK
jgi:excisionase family DNA binding protein